MTDHDLHGNHDPCPACEMRREALGRVPVNKGQVECNVCKGEGWLPLSDAEIVRRTCEEARRVYCQSSRQGLGVWGERITS